MGMMLMGLWRRLLGLIRFRGVGGGGEFGWDGFWIEVWIDDDMCRYKPVVGIGNQRHKCNASQIGHCCSCLLHYFSS